MQPFVSGVPSMASLPHTSLGHAAHRSSLMRSSDEPHGFAFTAIASLPPIPCASTGRAPEPFLDPLAEDRCKFVQAVTADGARWIANAIRSLGNARTPSGQRIRFMWFPGRRASLTKSQECTRGSRQHQDQACRAHWLWLSQCRQPHRTCHAALLEPTDNATGEALIDRKNWRSLDNICIKIF